MNRKLRIALMVAGALAGLAGIGYLLGASGVIGEGASQAMPPSIPGSVGK